MLVHHYSTIHVLYMHIYIHIYILYYYKAGTSDEQGQRVEGILKDLQSQKFLKYLHFMMDVTKVLSTFRKTFQSDKLCITYMVTTLETTLPLLD